MEIEFRFINFIGIIKMQKNSKNFVFYHIPKTGGTAIFNITSRWKNHRRACPDNNHVRISEIEPKADEVAYCVIRHPYSRFVSAFYHMVDACNDKFFYKNATVSDCEWLQNKRISMSIFKNDPNEFLFAMQEKIHPYHTIAQEIFYYFDIFKPQFFWICNEKETGIDHRMKHFLRQETLEKDFKEQIAGNEGVSWPNDSVANKRISNDTKSLNDLSKAIIRNLYMNDFHFLHFTV